MAPLLFREMKGVNFSCASPSSAAICTSIDRKSMVRPSTIGRAIDRHSPHLRDLRRRAKTIVLNSKLSQAPTKPKSYLQYQKKKSSWQGSASPPLPELTSPPGSSRYLLTTAAADDDGGDGGGSFIDVFQDSENAPGRPPLKDLLAIDHFDQHAVSKASSSPPAEKQEQVVALRVSLHCKGCEAKVRKHISRMEGVKSFEINFVTKKVTVIGEVTPLGVLNSVSKVKNAQFWPSPAR